MGDTKPKPQDHSFVRVSSGGSKHMMFLLLNKKHLHRLKKIWKLQKIIHGVFGVPFLFFKRPQWDKFAGADDTYAADCIMPDGRALQLPSTHMLGQHFSKAFGVKYMDAEGKEQYGWQTCYGPCISRIYAAVISVHGDDKGLILPFELAPVQVVIVPIYKGENKKIVDSECGKIEKYCGKAE